MTTQSAVGPRPGSPVRVELLVLAALAVLTFALIPIRIETIYSDLPAHPLFLHVPVILIPVAGIGALVLAARPGLFERHGVWLALVTVIGLGSLNLTMGAGKALQSALHLGGHIPVTFRSLSPQGGAALLVERHAHAADTLRILMILFTAAFLVTVAAYRTRDGSRTGLGIADGALRSLRRLSPSMLPARLIVAVLAVGCLYFVYHTGDLGAKAVWQGRLGNPTGAHGRPPGFGGGASGGAPVYPGG